MSDDAALLQGLEEVIEESRKLRVRLDLLQRQVDFYPPLTHLAARPESLPELAVNPQIAKFTFHQPKTSKEDAGIFAGLRTVPPNPGPGWLLRGISALPVQARSPDVALDGDGDAPELAAAREIGV